MKSTAIIVTFLSFTASSVSATSKFCAPRSAPDYDCYATGWPYCCDEGGCGSKKPACDVPPPGAEYCTEGFDYQCYTQGKPDCCMSSGNTCPRNKPPCNVPKTKPPVDGNTYCTWSPEPDCYKNNGFPKCCSVDPSSCPKQQPKCDIRLYGGNSNGGGRKLRGLMTGTSYCTWAPDKTCYKSGWPSCCSADGNNCPKQQPPCDVPAKKKCKTKRRYTPVYQEVSVCAEPGTCNSNCEPIQGQSGQFCVEVCNTN